MGKKKNGPGGAERLGPGHELTREA